MMDELALKLIKGFQSRYFSEMGGWFSVLDVGGRDVNGSCRALFDPLQWVYTGLDIEPGENVDLCVRDPYSWTELPSGRFDVVICCNTLEHVEFPWLTVAEIGRVMKPGGLCLLIAPSKGTRHRHPIDCWRFQQRGMDALAKCADLSVLENVIHRDNWGTVMLVGQKKW